MLYTYHCILITNVTYYYIVIYSLTYHYIVIHSSTYYYIVIHSSTYFDIVIRSLTYYYIVIRSSTYYYIVIRSSTYYYIVICRSQDDVYTIYAALSSGPSCHILSSDDFGDHAHTLNTLDDKANFLLFNRWKRSRTCLRSSEILELRGIDKYTNMGSTSNDVSDFTLPLTTHLSAQVHDNCWHVPIHNKLFPFVKPRFARTQHWLCLPAAPTLGKKR